VEIIEEHSEEQNLDSVLEKIGSLNEEYNEDE
jgi:hypothetical protein